MHNKATKFAILGNFQSHLKRIVHSSRCIRKMTLNDVSINLPLDTFIGQKISTHEIKIMNQREEPV